jgi:hypothetical protein
VLLVERQPVQLQLLQQQALEQVLEQEQGQALELVLQQLSLGLCYQSLRSTS